MLKKYLMSKRKCHEKHKRGQKRKRRNQIKNLRDNHTLLPRTKLLSKREKNQKKYSNRILRAGNH